MSALALYEATRGFWRMGERRAGAKFALAVFEGVVREAFEIDQWHPAGATPYATRDASKPGSGTRWEFTGRLAPDLIRAKYVDKSVANYLTPGSQNPIAYVNC